MTTQTEPRLRELGHGAAPRRRFLNRELAWVDFDRRVLELAADQALPLLERVKLCAIVSSNLDEFFAVRVARLQRLTRVDPSRQSPDGRTPAETLGRLRAAITELRSAQDTLWVHDLQPRLAAAAVRVIPLEEATPRELRTLEKRCAREIEPLLTPIAVGPTAEFPHIPSRAVALAVAVRDVDTNVQRFVCVKVPSAVPRFISAGSRCWVAAEELVAMRLGTLLAGATVEASVAFRPTRDADLVMPDGDDGLLTSVEEQVDRRYHHDIVCLELSAGASDELVAFLLRELRLAPDQLYETVAPVGLADLAELAELDRPELLPAPWRPRTPHVFTDRSPPSVLGAIRRRDVLVHHPYESFDRSVQAFVDAARDPTVAALKATIYRAGHPAPTLAALVATAAEEKHAVSVVELRARFDERRNIEWSRVLKRSGVDVVHGAPEKKVHAKLALVVRSEEGGVRRYVHVGTGNYHASNAFDYEDVSLFTADEDICADVAEVFNALTAGTRPPSFRKLLVGPWFLREGLEREMDACVQAAHRGEPAQIRFKVNSITDPAIADALYVASQAGVDIQLIVRGICIVRAGVPGLSDRITVRSVLGRFLEHSRIFSFQAGDSLRVYIGSADLMTRNLDRRIETLVPIEDSRLRGRLSTILDSLAADTRSTWELRSDDRWRRVRAQEKRAFSAQEAFMQRASKRSRKHS